VRSDPTLSRHQRILDELVLLRRLGIDRRTASTRLPTLWRTALPSRLHEETAMTKGPNLPLTDNEEVTLRRVAYGQSEVRAMRQQDLTRLHALKLIEDSKDGPRLTADGKLRFDGLPKAAVLDNSGALEGMLKTINRSIAESPKRGGAPKSKGPAI
jgi:hypothetical protein